MLAFNPNPPQDRRSRLPCRKEKSGHRKAELEKLLGLQNGCTFLLRFALLPPQNCIYLIARIARVTVHPIFVCPQMLPYEFCSNLQVRIAG